MQLDYFSNRVGRIGWQCEGFYSMDGEGLCPACCQAFEEVLAEETNLSEDKA